MWDSCALYNYAENTVVDEGRERQLTYVKSGWLNVELPIPRCSKLAERGVDLNC